MLSVHQSLALEVPSLPVCQRSDSKELCISPNNTFRSQAHTRRLQPAVAPIVLAARLANAVSDIVINVDSLEALVEDPRRR